MRFFLSIVFVLLVAAGCAKREQVAAVASPEEAVGKGWENYRLGEFDRASRFFEQAINGAATNSETQLQARYALATTWNLRRPGEDRARAEAMYREILSASPSRDLAAWTSLALARMKHLVPVGEEPKMAEVRAAYQKVVDDFPGHLAAKESFIYKMATFIASLEAQQTRYAIACLSKYVGNPANKEFLQPAWSLMAVGHQTLREPERRLVAEIRALQCMEIDPSGPSGELGWAYWNIATIAEFDCGNFAVARAYYNKLLKDYPTDIKVYGTKQALKRMDEVEAKIRGEIPNPKNQAPNKIQTPTPKSKTKRTAGGTSRSDEGKVAVGFSPRLQTADAMRRVATVERFLSSLRDDESWGCVGPWVETHGYIHPAATRRSSSGWKFSAGSVPVPGICAGAMT